MGGPRGFFVKVTSSTYQVPPKSSSTKDIAWGVNLCALGGHKIFSIVESGPCHGKQRNNNNTGTKISRGREAAVPMESSQEQTPLH